MAYDFVQINKDDIMKKVSSLTPSEKRYILEVLEIYLSDGASVFSPDDACN